MQNISTSVLDCRVLVLNRHYMAIRIVNVKRAMSLLFRELAEVIDVEDGNYYNYDFADWVEISKMRTIFEQEQKNREQEQQTDRHHDWLHTVHLSIVVPRIVRLLFYDRLPRRNVTLNRRNIFARDHNRCQYCGRYFPTSELSLDHVIPRSAGGEASWENLVCACVKCNVKKGGRTPAQAHMKLITRPVKPKRAPVVNISLHDKRYLSWKQFLDQAYWSVELR